MEAIANIYTGEIHSGQGWMYFLLRPHSIYSVNVSSFYYLLMSFNTNPVTCQAVRRHMGECVWLEQTGRVRITLGEILGNSMEFAQLK